MSKTGNDDNPWQILRQSLDKLIAEDTLDIPLLPDVVQKAIVLAQAPDSDALAMARLIQSDPSLAAHVMRIANSVAYTPMANLVSLQQAISRLGMNEISEIALAIAVQAKLFHTPGYDSYIAEQWRYALATALWAKEIARHCRVNVEVAYLAGLLHVIGRPAVLHMILEIAAKNGFKLSALEIAELENSYQQQFSEIVLKLWKMPTVVIEAVVHYADFNSASESHTQAALVNAGSWFARHMLYPNDVPEYKLTDLPALEALNLYQDEVDQLLENREVIESRLQGMLS